MIIVITGASSGIGASAALRLAESGATVVPVGRSADRTREIAARLGTEPLIADYADLRQVRDLAARILDRHPRIDVLANNAGALVPSRQVTVDGHELTFQANHLAPFLLTTLLLPALLLPALLPPAQPTSAQPSSAQPSSAQPSPEQPSSARRAGRVINTSSFGHVFGRVRLDDLDGERRRYGGGWLAYGTSKLMNILFTRELARRRPGLDAVCFHPRPVRGVTGADTPIRFAAGTPMDRIPGIHRVALSAADGAGPLLHLATAETVSSGSYYNGDSPTTRISKQAADPDLAVSLWTKTEQILAPYLDNL